MFLCEDCHIIVSYLQFVNCSLKFPYLLRMCSFPRIVRKVMEFDFFGHGKSWNLNFQKEYEPWVGLSGNNANYYTSEFF